MASNAVLQDKQFRVPEAVARAQLAINLARPSRPRLATSVDQSRIIDLELKAGVSVKFTPDRRNELPDSFILLVGKLKEMEALHADWDSYGGKPLSDAAVLPAIQLALIGIHMCEAPNLFLRSNGGIGLRWHNGNRELEIDVDPNGKCTAFLVTPDGEVEVDEPKDADDLVQFVLQVCRMD
jgi:hypothetical protein